MTLIEEDKTSRKFIATFNIEMSTESDGSTLPQGLKCISVQEIQSKTYKSYHTFTNPQLISKDKIAFEAWNPLRYTSAEAIYIYTIKDGQIMPKAYDVIECLKTDFIFELKVIEENTFCIFSDKKMKIFISDKEQLQLI